MFSYLINKLGNLSILKKALNSSDRVSVFGCSVGEKIAITEMFDGLILYVAYDELEAIDVATYYKNNGFRTETLLDTDYPSFELKEIGKPNYKLQTIISQIADNELDVLVITPKNLFYRVADIKDYLSHKINLLINKDYDFDELQKVLVSLGYSRGEVVTSVGQFAVRGEIIDIFPLGFNQPIRLFFEFDTLKDIKEFDPSSFITNNPVTEAKILSLNYLKIDKEKVLKFLQTIKNKNPDIKERVEETCFEIEKNNYTNNYFFTPFADNICNTFLDILPENSLITFSDSKKIFDAINYFIKEFNQFVDSNIKSHIMFATHKILKLDFTLNFRQSFCLLAFQNLSNANNLFMPKKVFNFQTLPYVKYIDNPKLLNYDLSNYLKNGYTILLYARSNEGAVKLQKFIQIKDINVAQNITQAHKNAINILPRVYMSGFSFVEEKLVVIASEQLFDVKTIVNSKVTDNDVFIPQVGGFVVHNIHGVGRCLGIQRLNLTNTAKDYVVVEYKNNDKLFVPVENIDSLSKFVGSDSEPKLNKLGGAEFANIKAKVKSSLKEMAFDLVKLYAEREHLKGYKYPEDDEMQSAFEKSFGFVETPDQLTSIQEIKNDMTSGKVMDRLVCGDVGFGKTEVALRSAFKTLMAGKMVAFLCPTTILSQQHFNTCMVRMANFGVRIEVLNRFKTPSETEAIINAINNGEVDIVVGTHKLLNKQISFKNLGLLILDEEQKFGVEDKEKIKNLRANVNVLTLSATPIPRTLHMSMVGIRDISVINTPPVSRIATAVQVTEYNDELLRLAIEKEVSRSGQVLVIYNRVESIYKFAYRVKSLLNNDEISIDVAHGQMPEKDLEDAIFKLYNNQTQVLIATTLIENGVDLPNANTLFVIDADNLGLSQLYQLKGRIGRSDKQAYAYFTYQGNKLLTENGYKRLEAISEFTTMGSGYKIAMRDLEIRGAGNVLGKEQSGHLLKVGYAMYLELLNQAVCEVKGEKVLSVGEVTIDTDTSAFIPDYYVENYSQRISTYVKISHIKTENDLLKTTEQLTDVFGIPPIEVINLCKISYIKNLCATRNICKVIIRSQLTEFVFDSNDSIMKPNVSQVLLKYSGFAVLNLEKLPIIKLTNNSEYNKNNLSKLDGVIVFLKEFENNQ